MWDTTRALAPFVLLLGAVTILRPERARNNNQSTVTLIVLVAGFRTHPIPFFCPRVFLLRGSLSPTRCYSEHEGIWSRRRPSSRAHAPLPRLVGVRQLDRQALSSLGHQFDRDPQIAMLNGNRASIRVLPEDKRELDSVRALVALHTAIGDPIFAGPDAPEVYFLTQTRNVTRSIMDFLDASGATRGDKLIATLRNARIHVVVINHDPAHCRRSWKPPRWKRYARDMRTGSGSGSSKCVG